MSGEVFHAFEPDWAVAPGEMLREWMCEDLARRCALESWHIEQLCAGAAELTEDAAAQLEQVTGTPARLWLRMEENYRAALARRENTVRPDQGAARMAAPS